MILSKSRLKLALSSQCMYCIHVMLMVQFNPVNVADVINKVTGNCYRNSTWFNYVNMLLLFT